MKLQQLKSQRSGIFPSLFLALAVTAAPAQVTVDGIRNASDIGYTQRALQTIDTGWGENNSLANLHTAQDGGNLAISIGGRSDGNGLLLFIDSTAGGVSTITPNLITSGGEEYTINNLATSATVGMTFEAGFKADYAIRIFGAGADAYVNIYNLQTGARVYAGNAGGGNITSGIVTSLRAAWLPVTPPYADVVNGLEMKLSLTGLGVPFGAAQPIRLMAVLVNGGSDTSSNQVLAPITTSTDIGGAIRTINFETEPGTQSISFTVDNVDSDGDGIPNATDPDDDNDTLLDSVENGDGNYVSPAATGTNPLLGDSDGDGVNDGLEVAGGQFGLGGALVSNPNRPNYTTMTVPGTFTSPPWQVDGSVGNTMTRVGTALTDQYNWTLDYKFSVLGDFQYKYAGNGSYTTSWGGTGPGGNVLSTIAATGIHTFAFNNAPPVGSVTRKVFPDSAAYLAAYALAPGDDTDSDTILNAAEFVLNTDPTNTDTDGDTLLDAVDPQPLIAAPQSRDVIFNVDMSVQIARGTFKPSAGGTVVVKIFSGILIGNPDLAMTDANSDGIYQTLPTPVVGLPAANFGNYKFFNSTSGAPNSGYETTPDRTFLLGPAGVTQTLPDPTAFFNGENTLPTAYADWSGSSGYNLAPEASRNDDADDDGFTNHQEFLFGTPPNSSTGALMTITAGTGNAVLSWLQRTYVTGYSLMENNDLGAWSAATVVPVPAADQTAVPAGYTRYQATVPATAPKTFFRVMGVEY